MLSDADWTIKYDKTIVPTVGPSIHTGSMEVSAIKPKSLFSLYLYKGIYKLLLLKSYSAIFENGSAILP